MGLILTGGTSGIDAEVDSGKSLQVVSGLPAHPAAGGFYTACGGPAGIVAAGLAADVSLMAMRFATGSARKAYLTYFRFTMSPATLGAAAGVAGSIGLQRFTAATPSGGTARTPNELNEPLATLSDMTSIQDLASALTVTSVVFGTEIARSRVPLFVANAGGFIWEFAADQLTYPVVLQPGDGVALRTRVAMAATQTWVFDWSAAWYER